MPELPEVETTKLSLAPLLGLRVQGVQYSGHRLREPIPDLSPLIGATFVKVTRRAKYLLLEFKNERTFKLLVHLGMSGSLGQYENLPPRKHDHVVLDFGDYSLHYHDPRRFGIIAWADDNLRYLAKLGIEPLTAEFNADYLYHKIHQSNKGDNRPITRPIKAVIMEQAIVVGVGNIYASESLFLARIHPKTPAHLLSKAELKTLITHIKAVLNHSITVGGSTLRDFTVADGKNGYFQQTLNVYGRAGKPCPNCHLPLENTKIAGRASVFCPHCQPML